MDPINETSVLLFSSKSEDLVNVEHQPPIRGSQIDKSVNIDPPNESVEGVLEHKDNFAPLGANPSSRDNSPRKNSISPGNTPRLIPLSEPRQKQVNIHSSVAQIIIETRDATLKTSVEPFIKFDQTFANINTDKKMWLDFRSSEVHDFLDVITGRKQHLRRTEHVIQIAKNLGFNLMMLDEEYNRFADIIRESILIEIYKLFPGGKITNYNGKLILIQNNNAPISFKCLGSGLNLVNAIDQEIRKKFNNYTKIIQEYIWKRVNGSIIHLKGRHNAVIPIRIIITPNFSEYLLFYNPTTLLPHSTIM